MPIEFDPAWEYYVPSTEWLEAFEEEGRADGFARIMPGREDRHQRMNLGLRFGRGNPNYVKLHLGPEKQTRESQVPDFMTCHTCGQQFRPDRIDRKYCSMFCIVRLGAKKVIPVKNNCARCGKEFKPLYTKHRFCSRGCSAYLGAPQGPSNDLLCEFSQLYLAGTAMKTLCEHFNVKLSCLKKWKKKLGLESRKSGRPSVTISKKLMSLE